RVGAGTGLVAGGAGLVRPGLDHAGVLLLQRHRGRDRTHAGAADRQPGRVAPGREPGLRWSGVWRLIGRRLLISVPLVLVVTLLTFLLQSLTPVDTARAILGQNYTPEGYAALRTRLGLDEPLLVRYWEWLVGAFQGDLGTSPVSGLHVGSEILNRLG